MVELIEWLAQSNERKVITTILARNSTDYIFVCYLAIAIISKKPSFALAFLLTLIYSSSGVVDLFSDVNFYLGYALIYCLLYFYAHKQKERIRTLAAIILIMLLSVWSAIDAWLYPEVETAFYQAYPFFYVFVHFCCIISLINWRILRSIVGAVVNYFHSLCGIGHAATFCYNRFKSLVN